MFPSLSLRLSSLVLLALVVGCTGSSQTTPQSAQDEKPETPDGPPWFEDITEKSGLNFVHDPGPDLENYLMYQSVGSGCAIVDLDGDGRPDLVLLNNSGPSSKSTNKLYRQRENGTFEDVTAGSGLDFSGWNMGIAIGDVNNDGKPDILITQVHGVRLLLNQGGMKFIDVTAESGLANPLWGTSAAFFDYDRDGWLDLVVVNYIDYVPSYKCRKLTGELDYCGPAAFSGTTTKLFRNRGAERAGNPGSPRVLFEDTTVKSRLGEKPGPGLGVTVADFDGDGWPDILIANDGQPNHLWINKHDGTFAEEAASRGIARNGMGHAFAGMGIAVGDIDNDGLLDFYITHMRGETNTLWKQGPKRGQFHDATAAWGLMETRWRGTGFGTAMADFDNDGWLDIAVVNGRVKREPRPTTSSTLSPHWAPYGDRNQVFASVEGKKFRDISQNNPAFCGYETVARGMACGDIDGDGAPDLLVNAIGEKARLFRNVSPKRGHWVSVKAFDPVRNRDAIGATVIAAAGGVQRMRVIGSGESFLSAGPLAAHIGLGNAEKVDNYEVIWPDGTRERFPGGAVDQPVVLQKGTGIKSSP